MIQPMVDIQAERGKRIRKVILESGKSQKEVAELIGVTPQSITKWISTGKIYIDNVQALADATGTDVRYILSGQEFSKDPASVTENIAHYHTQHFELHTLINELSPAQAKKLTLCAKALIESGDSDLEVSISIGGEKV